LAAGVLVAEAASAAPGVANIADNPGKFGHVNGAETTGADPDVDPDSPATVVAVMAQRCTPCRRQHAGRFASSLPGIAADSGPNPNTRIRKMEKPRRI
jgi:hypothetical protein